MSDPGFWDLIRMARRPIVASHSNSRALCAHPRNLTDDMFRAIRDSGGVVGINLYRDFVGKDGTMEELVAHVERFLELGGEKTLCLGGDLDGCEALAAGMRGLQDVPLLYEALAARGYGKELLEDIFWNNLRRIL
jgi:membrane dipeptidase